MKYVTNVAMTTKVTVINKNLPKCYWSLCESVYLRTDLTVGSPELSGPVQMGTCYLSVFHEFLALEIRSYTVLK